MDKVSPSTPDITQENIAKIAELFPDVVTETLDGEGNVKRSIDFDALRADLGDVVDSSRERYQFTWPGKREAKEEARRPTSKTLRPVPEKSRDWDTTQNVYIEGDNLEALKIMRETYAGEVKLIYIDPPYNTGHDFIYRDKFAESREDYNAQSGDYDEEGGRLVANPESNGRFHSDWCSMIYPRLLLARNLLSKDGAIFISIDDNESMNLRKICDEVFGPQCFVGDIAWQRTYSTRNDSTGIVHEIEHIFVYSKAANWQPKRLARSEEMDAKYKNPDGDRCAWTSDNPFAPNAATHQGMVYAIQHPITGDLIYPSDRACWRYQQDEMLSIMNGWCSYELRDLGDARRRAAVCGISPAEVRKGVKGIVVSGDPEQQKQHAMKVLQDGPWPRFYFTKGGYGGVRRKTYLDSVGGQPPTNLWLYDQVGHTDEAKKEIKKLFNGSAPFDTPKPTRLMRRILDIASESGSTVLDFFSGSASMAEAVISENADDCGSRRFILVQLPESASGEFNTLCDIGEERIRRAGDKIAAEVEESNRQAKLGEEPKRVPDIGFRVLRVDDSCLKDQRVRPGETEQATLDELVDNTVEGADALALLFQALPSFRIPYSEKIEERELCGHTVYDVGENKLLACFDEGVSADLVEAIARRKPQYALFRDATFADDTAAANFEEKFRTFSPDTVCKVI